MLDPKFSLKALYKCTGFIKVKIQVKLKWKVLKFFSAFAIRR